MIEAHVLSIVRFNQKKRIFAFAKVKNVTLHELLTEKRDVTRHVWSLLKFSVPLNPGTVLHLTR